jgi:hypothetical protein
MQQQPKTHKFAVIATVGTVAAVLLTLLPIPFVTPSAEATPALAKGKACKTCHASSSPSKSDLKKKQKRHSEIEEIDFSIVAHLPRAASGPMFDRLPPFPPTD